MMVSDSGILCLLDSSAVDERNGILWLACVPGCERRVQVEEGRVPRVVGGERGGHLALTPIEKSCLSRREEQKKVLETMDATLHGGKKNCFFPSISLTVEKKRENGAFPIAT